MRKRLQNRRKCRRQKVTIGGPGNETTLFISTGEYDDGTVGEIFVDLSKEGCLLRSLMNCFCIAVSVALQYGAGLDDFVRLFVHTRFEPSGRVQHHTYIKRSSSILDLVFRDLAIHYLGRDELKNIQEGEG